MTGVLANRRAIVTGGTRGIGRAISTALARAGANVAMFYQSRSEDADALARDLGALGSESFALRCDVSEPLAQDDAMDEAIARLGGLDLLICNAGLTITGNLAEIADDAFDRVYAVNVRSPFYAARKAARAMAEDGRIVLIGSSIAARVPGPTATLYASSKAALDGMARGLARDLADKRITVNVVHPGPIATERNPAGSDRANISASPLALRRYGEPEEVAALVLLLCSPEGAYITGQAYNVDGGWSV